ncbi:MAG: HAD hydrolase-like protein, partial [Clostridia bacterium]|nr:HAD hydrolase-like protein [Clostridia bacterium]
FIGPPIKNSFEKIYGIHGDRLQEMTDCFRYRYSAEDLLKAKAYEGIYKVFEELRKKSVKTAIATYKRHDYAVNIMRSFKFDKYSDIIFGADNDNKLKKKDIIEKCISVSGVTDRRKVVMIGDSDNDAIGAEQLGIDFVAVTYGFGFHVKEDCNAYANVGIAEKPVDILELIK